MKPQLTSAPIWLELRQVPFQFFNDEGLERIASLVGDPKFLHPSTANKTNLEVAKVFTIIDPRKPLPEAVNVQFDSGEIRRVLVSSPWMPPVCEHCKEIGHNRKRCKLAPITCMPCKSTAHSAESCPRKKPATPNKRYQKRSLPKDPVLGQRRGKEVRHDMVYVPKAIQPAVNVTLSAKASEFSAIEKGSGSGKGVSTQNKDQAPSEGNSSHADEDSSDILSSESEDSGCLEDDYSGFEEVLSKRQRKGNKGNRGKSLTVA